VFAADLTRLGRDAIEWFRLLDLCRAYDVLLTIDGKVYDIRDNSELLVTRLVATIGEPENLMRRHRRQTSSTALAKLWQTWTTDT